MNLKKVKKINQVYKKKAKEANYNNEHYNDIAIASTEVICWSELVNTKADFETFGEFTRRFKKAMDELKILMEV